MSQDLVLDIFKASIKMTLLLVSPFLLAIMVIGLIISIFQAATQIHETTLTFVPKILVVVACMLVLFPWMMNHMTAFTVNLFSNLPVYVR